MQTATAEQKALFRQLGWWGDTTVWQLFRAAVDAAPAQIALVDPENRSTFSAGDAASYTWSELEQRVNDMRARLSDSGVVEGDVVVLQLPNLVESIVTYLALASIGAIASPVPMQYGGHELRGIAAKVKPAAYVSTANFKGENFLQTRAAAFPAGVRVLDAGADRTGGPAADARVAGAVNQSADDVFTICWTSGTTGTPKGVPRSHNQWLAQTAAMGDIGVQPGMSMLCPFPMVNMASLSGFFFPWLQFRGKLVLHHPLDISVFLHQIEHEKVAYTIAPPALLNMLLQSRELMQRFDLSSLRLVASGSAPLSPWMVRGFQEEFGIEVVNIFGSNEGMALVSGAADVPDPEKRATLFPRFGVTGINWSNRMSKRMRTRLVDPDSGEIIDQPGTPGEMQIWGANVIDGYFDAPETNSEVFSEDGFFRTGDLFEIAGEGEDSRYYRFVGRCKDIIIRGGMKISPDELDTLLAGHAAIAEVAVVGYPDAVLGERICAVVVPKPGMSVTLADLIAFLEQQQVARIKLPEKLRVVEQLPRNPLGKVLRAALKDLVTGA